MYKYYLTMRPRSIGTQPRDLADWKDYDKRTYVEEINHKAWGELYYERRLTQDEIKRYELIDVNGPEILANPTGVYLIDKYKELAEADYAVIFRNRDGKAFYNTVFLHSPNLDEHGKLWRDGAFGNMKILVRSGAAEAIYLLTEKGQGKAFNAARQEAHGKEDFMEVLEKQMQRYAIRIITWEYLEVQEAVRKAST